MHVRSQALLIKGVGGLGSAVIYGFLASRDKGKRSRRDLADTVVSDDLLIARHVRTGGVTDHEKNFIFVFTHVGYFHAKIDMNRMPSKKTVRGIFVC